MKTSWAATIVLIIGAVGAFFLLTRGPSSVELQSAQAVSTGLSNQEFVNLAQIRLRREGKVFATGEVQRDGNAVLVEGYTRDTDRYRLLFDAKGNFVMLELNP